MQTTTTTTTTTKAPPVMFIPDGGEEECEDYKSPGFNTYSFLGFLLGVVNIVSQVCGTNCCIFISFSKVTFICFNDHTRHCVLNFFIIGRHREKHIVVSS